MKYQLGSRFETDKRFLNFILIQYVAVIFVGVARDSYVVGGRNPDWLICQFTAFLTQLSSTFNGVTDFSLVKATVSVHAQYSY